MPGGHQPPPSPYPCLMRKCPYIPFYFFLNLKTSIYILVVKYQITNDPSISIVESRILQILVLIGIFSSIARFNYWKITYASFIFTSFLT